MLGYEYQSVMGAMRNHGFYSERHFLVSRFVLSVARLLLSIFLQCALGTSEHKTEAVALLPSVTKSFKLVLRSLNKFRASAKSGN